MSAQPLRDPIGQAAVAPLIEPQTWIDANCSNAVDFRHATPQALQEVIRLHNHTCVTASGLNAHVVQQHKTGIVGTIPGTTKPLTQEDYKALRDAMRRRNPAYKLPPLTHKPTPSNWQLYVAQDSHSGPDFATIAYVDTTMATPTATGGYTYGDAAIRIPLGYIPVRAPAGAVCTPQRIVDLLGLAAKKNKLLTSAPGGWRSTVSGLPAAKSSWSSADAAKKFNRLCADLTRLSMSE